MINSPAISFPVVVCESSGALEVVELGGAVDPAAVVVCGPVVDTDVDVAEEPQAYNMQARATATVVSRRPGPNPFILEVYVRVVLAEAQWLVPTTTFAKGNLSETEFLKGCER